MSFADEGMGTEDDLIEKMESLVADHGTKPFKPAHKAINSGKMRKKRKKGL